MVELPDLARRLLDGKNFATVSTLMGDGQPQASVVWIHTDGPTSSSTRRKGG